MNKIIEISKKPYIAIFTDETQYIVWIGKTIKKGKEVGKIVWFLPNLEMALSEIAEWILMNKLSKKTLKDMNEMKAVFLDTNKQIKKLFKLYA